MAYVDKAKLMSRIESELIRWGESEYNVLQILGDIEGFPTADVVEVKHGEWVDLYNNKYDNHLYVCSVCGGKALYKFERNELGQEEAVQDLSVGCPHCLAKMDSQL